ncbi:MAG: phosphatase PAP2 family protein [Gaiellaceae bacterium]
MTRVVQPEDIGRRRPPPWPSLLGVAVPLLAFVVLAARVPRERPFGWDIPVANAVDALAPVSSGSVHLDPYIQGITIGVAVATALVALVLLARRQTRAAVFLLAAVGGSVLLSALAKAMVRREAIESPAGEYSFPSGSGAWSLATLLALLLLAPPGRPRRVLALVGLAFVLGYAALITFEEWHYPSDLVASWCLAAAWVAALSLVLPGRAARSPVGAAPRSRRG